MKAREVLSLMHKYRPETKLGKRLRLKKQAEEQAAGKDVALAKRPMNLTQGINRVVTAVCRKMGVAYCILKSKARLGALVRRKICAAVCLTDVDGADKAQLSKVIESVKTNFNDRADDIRKTWGGGALSAKAAARKQRLENAKLAEQKKAE